MDDSQHPPPPPALPPGDDTPDVQGSGRRVPWSAWAAAAAAFGALALGFALSIPIVVLDGPDEAGDLSTNALIFAQLMTVVGFLSVPFWLASRHGGGLRAAAHRLGLRGFKASAIGWTVLAAIAYYAFLIAYALLVMSPDQDDIASDFGALPVQILLIVVAASFAEEICFRGMLYAGLRNRLGPLLAALVAGLFFGGLHATTGVSAVPPLIAFGVVLALLYEKTGSLWPPVILHALNNGVALWALHSGG